MSGEDDQDPASRPGNDAVRRNILADLLAPLPPLTEQQIRNALADLALAQMAAQIGVFSLTDALRALAPPPYAQSKLDEAEKYANDAFDQAFAVLKGLGYARDK